MLRARAWLWIAASISMLSLAACTPDGFEYGTPGGAGSGNCARDGCPQECPAGTIRDATGACLATCGPWSANVDLAVPSGVALAAGNVVAVGTSSDWDGRPAQAQLAPLTACSGAPGQGTLPFAPDQSGAGAVAADADDVWVAGVRVEDTATEASLSVSHAGLLGAPSVTALGGTPPASELSDIALDTNAAWVAGSALDAAQQPVPWLARVAPDGTACTSALSGSGRARGVAAYDGGAVVVIERPDGSELERFAAGSCEPPGCDCQPAFVSSKLAISARDVAVAGDTAYVAGFDAAPGEPSGVLLAIDLGSSSETGSAKWDPAPNADAFFVVAADSERVYVGGTSGALAFDDIHSGAGAIVAYALPLGEGAVPEWSSTPPDLSRVVGLVLDDSSVFALAARSDGASLVTRCNLDDGC